MNSPDGCKLRILTERMILGFRNTSLCKVNGTFFLFSVFVIAKGTFIGSNFRPCSANTRIFRSQYVLDNFPLGACQWSELFIYFGSNALWALKFHFFFGRLITNKRLPITDNCQKNIRHVIAKARRINTHLKNKTRTN